MRLSDLAKGSSVFLGVIVAGYVSTVYVDQRLASPPKAATQTTASPAPTSTPAPTESPTNGGSACIGEGGSWKNWPWPNVPMGSPKCK
ncbi:hypothetical protein [Bradyrhizobium guangzhouense]|uniref:Uncharacterized protein n=1 Tax=Bradyrhizobium guangzhouense TaxID=1325095 RepID=A0AAE5WXP5_9BRAD|nr:hypothetical protein [Bradyrhizobium guangzhouense]QAU45014.1 hypothetical protein XH91_06395 [Bradyrhizobium guangzhouense]RXH16501.1 hypothetical protein EAS56_05740 [Bradyrhizobium guangzhouense]